MYKQTNKSMQYCCTYLYRMTDDCLYLFVLVFFFVWFSPLFFSSIINLIKVSSYLKIQQTTKQFYILYTREGGIYSYYITADLTVSIQTFMYIHIYICCTVSISKIHLCWRGRSYTFLEAKNSRLIKGK